MIKIVDRDCLARMFRSGAANLTKNRQSVNDLNVFPIPDGDTGDNMSMTVNAGVSAADISGDIGLFTSTFAHGTLLGARGNSGVILSRIFAGIASGLDGVQKADLKTFAAALSKGVTESYSAVSEPVEGTILTVYRESVAHAVSRVTDESDFCSFFDDLTAEASRSLDRTPELLAVLKEAGVVDSGGAGLLCILEGMRSVLQGREIAAEPSAVPAQSKVDLSLFSENDVMEFGYCTEFLLRLQTSKVDLETFDVNALSDWLSSVGESVVCFRDGSIVKAHVHTFHPGEILNYVQRFGEFLTLKIENMKLQHSEVEQQKAPEAPIKRRKKKVGVVAVGAGEGIHTMMKEAGVDVVIDGGQSMNPSVDAFLKAFDEVAAESIYVFPNNGNVILTANQAAELYENAAIHVIPTHTVGEGYVAVSMLDTASADAEATVAELTEIAKSVVTACVSPASRDTEKDGVAVHAGDFIGFAGDTIYADASDPLEVLKELAAATSVGDYDVAILFCGKDASSEEADAAYAALSAAYPRTEIIMQNGGQPIFRYMLVLQ